MEWKPPTSIDGVSFDEIYELFANSSYGKRLRREVRYGLYKPEELSNEEWVKVLGPDINNLEHLKTTFEVAGNFIYHARHPHPEWVGEINFSEEEERTLCLTAVIHDWGEAVMGDIQWHRKTAKDRQNEFEILKGLIEELCRYKFVDPIVEKMYLAADVAFDKDEKLSPAFNAIEHVGYAKNAFHFWKEGGKREGLVSKLLLAISKKLIADHYSTWQRYEKIYPGTHHFLLENKDILDEIKNSALDWRTVPILANN